MRLTMMEAKILLTCQGGAVLWSSELGAVMEGLEERQRATGVEVVAYDKASMRCVPSADGLRRARIRIRQHFKASRRCAYAGR